MKKRIIQFSVRGKRYELGLTPCPLEDKDEDLFLLEISSSEDQGYFLSLVELPPESTDDLTDHQLFQGVFNFVVKKVDEHEAFARKLGNSLLFISPEDIKIL